MTKLILIVSAVAGLAVLTPSAAAASDCSRGYVQCLNDSWDLSEPFQTMADVECAASYVGCIRKAILSF